MTAFDDACEVEKRGVAVIDPYLRRRVDGRLVLTHKGRLSRSLQERVGDGVLNASDMSVHGVEFKVEERWTGNLFIEEWSNRSQLKRGWFEKLDTDWLLYYFLDRDLLYILNFQQLRRWAYLGDGEPRLHQFNLRKQGRYGQLNDTWGRCVPVKVLCKELSGIEVVHPRAELQAERSEEEGGAA